jgi:hypothetical protein
MNVRTFEAYMPDNSLVTVSVFCDPMTERWDTLTFLTKTYPQLNGWGYMGDSEYMPHDYMLEGKRMKGDAR